MRRRVEDIECQFFLKDAVAVGILHLHIRVPRYILEVPAERVGITGNVKSLEVVPEYPIPKNILIISLFTE